MLFEISSRCRLQIMSYCLVKTSVILLSACYRSDLSVPEELQTTAGDESKTASVAEAVKDTSQLDVSSTSSHVVGVATNPASFDDNGCQNGTVIEQLNEEVSDLRARLCRADATNSHLRRHIELNTGAEGSSVPSFNPDVIVALVQEVDRLNAELERLRSASTPTASGSGEPAEEITAAEISPGPASQHSGSLKQDAACPASTQKSIRSASVGDLRQPCDAPLARASLLDVDVGAAGDGITLTTTSFAAQTSFLASPAARHLLRQSMTFFGSPFDATNQRAFAELQAEVERLRRQLQLTELENSRLLEQSGRESFGWFAVVAPGQSLVDPQSDTTVSQLATSKTRPSLPDEVSLVKYFCSATGDVKMSSGFLKKLVDVSVLIVVCRMSNSV